MSCAGNDPVRVTLKIYLHVHDGNDAKMNVN